MLLDSLFVAIIWIKLINSDSFLFAKPLPRLIKKEVVVVCMEDSLANGTSHIFFFVTCSSLQMVELVSFLALLC